MSTIIGSSSGFALMSINIQVPPTPSKEKKSLSPAGLMSLFTAVPSAVIGSASSIVSLPSPVSMPRSVSGSGPRSGMPRSMGLVGFATAGGQREAEGEQDRDARHEKLQVRPPRIDQPGPVSGYSSRSGSSSSASTPLVRLVFVDAQVQLVVVDARIELILVDAHIELVLVAALVELVVVDAVVGIVSVVALVDGPAVRAAHAQLRAVVVAAAQVTGAEGHVLDAARGEQGPEQDDDREVERAAPTHGSPSSR